MVLNFVRGRGGGEILVKAVFTSVYLRLAANSIQKHVKKGRCPKTFWPGLQLLSCALCIKKGVK